MATRKKTAKPDTASALSGALVEFVRADVAINEGLKKLTTAQKDFEVCARNKNLYSHALRALRHVAKQPCEARVEGMDCTQQANANFEQRLGMHCWPCYARDALRRGGEPS